MAPSPSGILWADKVVLKNVKVGWVVMDRGPQKETPAGSPRSHDKRRLEVSQSKGLIVSKARG